MKTKQKFYIGLVRWSDENEQESHFQIFWSWAVHIGEAIEKAINNLVDNT